MKCSRLFGIGTALLILCAIFPRQVAFADSVAPPYSYTVTSSDEQYIFVMISPRSVEKDAEPWIEKVADEIRRIRATYPRSGLYRNDGSTMPLWTVDWYSYSVNMASDGVHLVRHGPWAQSSDDEALSFFANGELIRIYTVSELVDFTWLLPHSVSHFFWLDKQRFDDARLRFHLMARYGEHYVFDVQTGEVISSFRLPRVVCGGVLTILTVAALFIWSRRRISRAISQEGHGMVRPEHEDPKDRAMPSDKMEMKIIRVLLFSVSILCVILVCSRGQWESTLTLGSMTWSIDLESRPIWSPPDVPSYDEFRKVFNGYKKSETRLPEKNPSNVKIARILIWDEMLIDLLLSMWGIMSIAGILYLIFRGKRRDRVLHYAMYLCIGLTGTPLLCVAVWLGMSGWDPQSPLKFAIVGIMMGLLVARLTGKHLASGHSINGNRQESGHQD